MFDVNVTSKSLSINQSTSCAIYRERIWGRILPQFVSIIISLNDLVAHRRCYIINEFNARISTMSSKDGNITLGR